MNLMIGTDPAGKGGIASVASVIIKAGFLQKHTELYIISHENKDTLIKSFDFLRAFASVIQHCIRSRPNIVHVHASTDGSFIRKSLILGVARLFGCKTIFHLHAGYFQKYATEDSGIFMRWWIRRTLQKSSAVIALSESWAAFLRSYAPGIHVQVIPNSVPLVALDNHHLEEPGRILFLGDLITPKGIVELLTAVAQLKSPFPAIKLVLGGTGDIAWLRSKIHALGIEENVAILGWIESEQKAQELRRAAIFALPSHTEGLPMAMLEAMAAGKAVVVSAVGGIPDVITNGKNGLLIPAHDVAALTIALQQLLEDPNLQAMLGTQARATIAEHYSSTIVLSRLSALYDELELPTQASHQPANRLVWLYRRLSRITPAEIPYRVLSVLRTLAQGKGWLDASQPVAQADNARFGKPWVKRPATEYIDTPLLSAAAKRYLNTGFPVFTITVPLNNGLPHWNQDPKTGIIIEKKFGLDIDFRHIGGGVDIKYLWELNRHIEWVHIAQAYASSDDIQYLNALSRLLDNWLSECPYPLGANWSSPVEHGIRLINWSIVWHLIGGADAPIFTSVDGQQLLKRWLACIYQHMRFASDNYSFYSSADNHLIGEAAGIFVAAHTWDLWPQSRVLRATAKKILEEEMLKQFSTDGVNLEQALCYHKFSLEFLLSALLCGTANQDDFSATYKNRLYTAITFLAAMMDCAGNVPAIGDSDDGRVFGFIGDGASSAYTALLRAGALLFQSQALTTKLKTLGDSNYPAQSWLVVPTEPLVSEQPCNTTPTLPERFATGGYMLLGKALHSPQEFRLTLDIGALGYNRIAGHGHADALSLLLSTCGQDFLIDPGTYCYNAAPELRHYFRGTSAHNTVSIDNSDQSLYGSSFLWLRDIVTTLHTLSDDGIEAIIEASHNGYGRLNDPVQHWRKLTFNRETLSVLVEDRFDCALPHRCTLHWHFSPDCSITQDNATWLATRAAGTLGIHIESPDFSEKLVCGQESPPLGWISKRFYAQQASPVLVIESIIQPDSVIRTRFTFSRTRI